MPFSDDFADVYSIGIKEACAIAGAYCERVDEQIFVESMLDRIYNQIAKADFVIADMTGRNANVFYEVGYAHALGKRTILLTRDAADIPFDLKHYPHIVYKDKVSYLRDELTKRVEWHIQNPVGEKRDSRIGIDAYVNNLPFDHSEVVHTVTSGKRPYFTITIHNNSSQTFSPDDIKIGIVTTDDLKRCRTQGSTSTQLPDGTYLHMLPLTGKLFPGAYGSVEVLLINSKNPLVKSQAGDYKTPITLRIYTDVGSRDFSSTIVYSQIIKNPNTL